MTKLSQAQMDVLIRAAQPEWTGAANEDARTIASLIQRGCLIASDTGDGPNHLVLTDVGREAARLTSAAAPTSALKAAPAADSPAAPGKIDRMLGLLGRPEGAAIDELMAATGWQAHSIRGAISGAIKKGRGLAVVSEKTEAGRTYRLEPAEKSDSEAG